jgi:hypothetical protein
MSNKIDSAIDRAKLKPFTAWMVYDALGIYESTLHHTRAAAESEKRDDSYLIDAKWRIAKVRVTPV